MATVVSSSFYSLLLATTQSSDHDACTLMNVCGIRNLVQRTLLKDIHVLVLLHVTAWCKQNHAKMLD